MLQLARYILLPQRVLDVTEVMMENRDGWIYQPAERIKCKVTNNIENKKNEQVVRKTPNDGIQKEIKHILW